MCRICQLNSFQITVLFAASLLAAPGYCYQVESVLTHDKVLQYLDSKGLARLAINHLEAKLVEELDEQKREQFAVEIARRYRQYFFSKNAETNAQNFIQQADWLSKNYPAVNTPDFRLAVNHAQYVQLEQQFRKWWRNSAVPEGRPPLIAKFRELEGKLAKQIRHDESQQQQLISEIGTDSSLQQALQIKTEKIEIRLLHSHYLFAWTSYFSAVLPDEVSLPLLRQAQTSFYRALRIEQPAAIDQIEAKWLDFSAPISGRALLGLASVYVALGRSKSAQFCIEEAAKISTPVFDRNVFEFNALVFSKKWEAAKEFVDKRKNGNFEGHKPNFWEAVAHAGFSQHNVLPNLPEPNETGYLRRAGLIGLAREFAFDQLRHFAVNEEINLPDVSYERKWIQILVQYHISASNDQDFKNQLQDIYQLMSSSRDQIERADLARMNFIAGMMEYKRGNFESALEQIEAIDSIHIQSEPAFAQRLDWLNVLIQLRRANQDAGNNAIALAAVNRFIEDYPDSNSYQRALFERFKLTNSILPAAQAFKIFEVTEDSHPYYHEVMLETVNCLRRGCLEEKSEVARSEFLKKLIETDQKLRSLDNINSELKLSSCLLYTSPSPRDRQKSRMPSSA